MLSKSAVVLGFIFFVLFVCTTSTCVLLHCLNTGDSLNRPDETSKGSNSSDNDEEISLECEDAEMERNECEQKYTKDISKPEKKQLAGTDPTSIIKTAVLAVFSFISACVRITLHTALNICAIPLDISTYFKFRNTPRSTTES